MRRFIAVVVCGLALMGVAATIQWFSDQPATTVPADTDILALERPSPHAYKSFTLLTLKGYIGSNGTFNVTYLTVQNITNSTSITTNLQVINQFTVYSNAYFISTNFQNVTVNTNVAIYNQVNVNDVFVTNVTVLSNAYFLSTNIQNVTINTNVSYNNTAITTNLYVLGAFVNTNYGVFPSASNTLAIGSGTNRWTLTLTGPGAITNVSGVGYGTMEITASGADRTFYVTNQTWLAIGDLTTNLAPGGAFLIPSGKVGMIDFDNITGTVKYSCAVQRAP